MTSTKLIIDPEEIADCLNNKRGTDYTAHDVKMALRHYFNPTLIDLERDIMEPSQIRDYINEKFDTSYNVETVRNWILDGKLSSEKKGQTPVVLRYEVERFEPPARGRPSWTKESLEKHGHLSDN